MTTEDDNKGDKRPHERKSRAPRPEGREAGRSERPRKSAPRKVEGEEDTSERIAKRLARAGIASRREAETMIAAGRIAVNGKVLESPAVNVKRTDVITVDGKQLKQAERTRLWLYHKPAGLVTTNRDPEGRPTVFEALPPEMPRVLSVGRLDINTEGLLLLTNDGGLSRVLELPSTGWLRRYRVRAHGKVTQQQLDELKNGIAVDGVFYGSVEAELERVQGANVWLSLGLREGKNREVKNILGALGLTVGRLIRISFGPFQLGDLEEGAVREIRGRILRDQLGDKLIEDAGADFDAPIHNEFSNTAVKGRTRQEMEAPAAEGERRRAPREREWISSQPERRKPRDDKKDDKTEPRRRGNANVWMAPGARPKGEKAAAKTARVEHQLPHRAPRLSTDMGVRPRRSEDEGRDREETGERRERRPSERPEGQRERRPGKRERAELRATSGDRPQGASEGRKFEGRSFESRKSGGPRGEGRFGGGSSSERGSRGAGKETDKRSKGFGDGPKDAFKGAPKSGGYGKSRDGNPGSGKPRDGKPRDGKPNGGKPGGGKPYGGKPGGGKPGGGGADRRR